MNSLCQYQKQHIEKSMENMDHDIIIKKNNNNDNNTKISTVPYSRALRHFTIKCLKQ